MYKNEQKKGELIDLKMNSIVEQVDKNTSQVKNEQTVDMWNFS